MNDVRRSDAKEKLGPEAFAAWIKFYSWCDRSDQ